MNKEICPVCEKKEMIEYITTGGTYVCCEHCKFEYLKEQDRNDK